MTSVLSYMNNSSSNSAFESSANQKHSTTFIIQPPSSNIAMPNSLLNKRFRASELGDLLKKKIKTQTSSDQKTSTTSENLEDAYDRLESSSMIEEVASPSTKSVCNETERENCSLLAQRCVSTPLVFSNLFMKASNSHNQLQNALNILQKKLLLDQQAAPLRELLRQAQQPKEALVIPALEPTSIFNASPVKKGRSQEDKDSIKSEDEESEIIYGPVQYPFLSMSASNNNAENSQQNTLITPAKYQKLADGTLIESLAVTRSETQKSESELSEEELSQSSEGKRRKTKKTSAEKVKKSEKKNRKQDKELLSPTLTARKKKLAERKLNNGQITQDEKFDQISEAKTQTKNKKKVTPVGSKYQVEVPTLNSRSNSVEKRVPKMKSSPLS